MFRPSIPSCRPFALCTLFLIVSAWPIAAAADARLSETYGQLPLQFEANEGQTHADVRFLSRGSGYNVYLTAREAVLVLARPSVEQEVDGIANRDGRTAHERSKVALRMTIVDGNSKPRVRGLEALPGKAHYVSGNDPAKWRTNIPTYAKVHYRGVYPGIDLFYYGNQRQLEYDFVVAPGADPRRIVLAFDGAERLEIDAQGDLLLRTAGGDARMRKPYIYQERGGSRQEIAGAYTLHGTDRVGFELAAYDRSRPLVIDPVFLSYSTFLGADAGLGVAVDNDGNAYVTGRVLRVGFNDFTATPGAYQPTSGGSADAFVTKLDPSGTAIIYSTFLGGSSSDTGYGIAVDATGQVYVAGLTASTDFPVTTGSAQTARGGGWDAFVTNLSPDGSGLVYSTYLGGTDFDFGSDIVLDAGGNAYVTGRTSSSDFPVTTGAAQTACAGGGSAGLCMDAFAAKLNAAGSALVYSTYLGGTGRENDLGGGIAVDGSGNAYVSGHTDSTDFPTTPGAFQSTYAGGLWDAFVTRLDSAGSSLVYSTYLGGIGFDQAVAIAADGSGAYVTGRTASPVFPAGNLQGVSHGWYDAFVTKLDGTGSRLVYSMNLGGSSAEEANGIVVNAAGNAYVTGVTNSTDFPTTPGAFQPAHAGGNTQEAFVTKLDATGTALVYSSYLGGTGGEVGFAIAVDPRGNAYLTGETGSPDFPTTPGAPRRVFGNLVQEAFVAKIVEGARLEQDAATLVGPWATYGSESGTFSGGTLVAADVAASTALFRFTGTALTWIGVKCSVCGIAAVSIDGGVPTMVNTAGPGAPGSLASEAVFSASGLATGVTHTITITVTGTTTSGGAYIAVDAFDVVDGDAVPLPPPPVALAPLPELVPPPLAN